MIDLSSLIQILPPAIVLAVVVLWLLLRYRRQLRSLIEDLRCLYSWTKDKWQIFVVNRGFRRSCKNCKEQPVFEGLNGSVLILGFSKDPKSIGTLELRGKNRALATIPKLDVDNVVKWARKHIQENVMPLFFIEDIAKLRKSMELVYLKLMIDHLGLDGAYRIAVYKILKEEFKRPHIKRLFNAFIQVNEELKSKPWVDKRVLKIILLETCKMELKFECR